LAPERALRDAAARHDRRRACVAGLARDLLAVLERTALAVGLFRLPRVAARHAEIEAAEVSLAVGRARGRLAALERVAARGAVVGAEGRVVEAGLDGAAPLAAARVLVVGEVLVEDLVALATEERPHPLARGALDGAGVDAIAE